MANGDLGSHALSGLSSGANGRAHGRRTFVYATHAQLAGIAGSLDKLSPGLGLAVWLMRGTGVRVAEALALKGWHTSAETRG